jgi:uncharacterized protein with PIN domain
MTRTRFRFYAQLNDFLPENQRQVQIEYAVPGNPSVKDAIEALGVPHTEVAMIHINGHPRSFEAQIGEGDEVAVFPAFARLTPDQLSNPFAQKPPDPVRFIADIHLGKLAASLRMLGFDTDYGQESDHLLAAHSRSEARILLTRDVGLLKRSQVQYGYYIRSIEPKKQIIEVLQRFQLLDSLQPFLRCSRCNGLIQPVPKTEIEKLVPSAVYRDQTTFQQCQSCRQVYWKGSHYGKLVLWIAELKRELQEDIPPML